MKRSENRVLTTHAGSLPRPTDLRAMLDAKAQGQPYDKAAFDKRVTDAVKEVVDKQVELGIDVIGEGEESKPGFANYLDERMAGFELKELSSGQVPSGLMRRIDPGGVAVFWASKTRSWSPTPIRRVPSGAKRIPPPMWQHSGAASQERIS